MNFYSTFPEQPYHKTSVEMGEAVAALKQFPVSKAVKIACYIIFRNESGNGKSGVNNNYCGFQADSARWPIELDKYITGGTSKKENMTGKNRLFLTFANVSGSLAFLIDRIQSRGLFVGGHCDVIVDMDIEDPKDWALCYWRSWVTGSKSAKIPKDELQGLLSMYRQGDKFFSH